VRQLVDANGEVLLAKSYRPYGELLDSASEETSSYGSAAEMRDPTGLIYLRARYSALDSEGLSKECNQQFLKKILNRVI
jgi:hypothetical protein